MPRPTEVRESAPILASPEAVFEAALSLPLPQLYSRRYGPMPPIVEVRDQEGEWTTPGQTRTFVTADGGSMHEEMLSIERPTEFTNELSKITGPFKPLVSKVVETWRFRELGTGTEATWEWNLYPTSAVTAVAMPIVARLWRGYARAALAQLSEEVVGR